jgi:hypothetical protein
MYAFRQRPLTWLFAIATLCVDAMIIFLSFQPRGALFNGATAGLLMGQCWALGAWLVLGHAHRLVRGIIVVLSVAAINAVRATAAYRAWGDFKLSWTFELEWYAVSAAVSAGAAWIAVLFVGRNQLGVDSPLDDRFHFPLVELFGWTIVVAVASWIFGAVVYEYLIEYSDALIVGITAAGIAGILAITNYQTRRPWLGIGGAAILMACGFGLSAYAKQNINWSLGWVLIFGFSYSAVWGVVRAIELRIFSAPGELASAN